MPRLPSRGRRRGALALPRTRAEVYARELRAIVDQLQLDAMKMLAPVLHLIEPAQRLDAVVPVQISAVWSQLEVRYAQLLRPSGRVWKAASSTAASVDALTNRQMKALARRARILPDVVQQNAFIEQNIRLVTSLVGNQLNELRSMVEQAALHGTNARTLTKDIEARFDVSRSRANLIARDQTLKLHGKLIEDKQKNAGATKYIWTTSGDERVREGHAELDGTVQSWDAPPVVSEDGRQEHPGQDFQCRCVPFPVFDEVEELDVNL